MLCMIEQDQMQRYLPHVTKLVRGEACFKPHV